MQCYCNKTAGLNLIYKAQHVVAHAKPSENMKLLKPCHRQTEKDTAECNILSCIPQLCASLVSIVLQSAAKLAGIYVSTEQLEPVEYVEQPALDRHNEGNTAAVHMCTCLCDYSEHGHSCCSELDKIACCKASLASNL
jgi:hypothetical protein